MRLKKEAGGASSAALGPARCDQDLVKSNSHSPLPSWRRQLTALFAAALVLTLAVFAASPELHAWLHGHEGIPVKGSTTSTGHNDQPAGQDDDGCAVVMFANGVVLAVLGFFSLFALGRLINLILWMGTAEYRQTLRYWLPPLCGPPLS